jgi:hypothetical protein
LEDHNIMGGRKKDGGGSSNNSAPDNSAQLKAMQDQQAKQAQIFAKQQADAAAAKKAADDAAAKAAADAAKQRAIASQSANARSLATTNQQEVSNKLQSTLNNPIQTGTMNYGAQASGFNPAAAKQDQAATMGGAGMPTPMASPGAAVAAKVNADAGGTNAVQNRYTMPNTQGLQFGGT